MELRGLNYAIPVQDESISAGQYSFRSASQQADSDVYDEIQL